MTYYKCTFSGRIEKTESGTYGIDRYTDTLLHFEDMYGRSNSNFIGRFCLDKTKKEVRVVFDVLNDEEFLSLNISNLDICRIKRENIIVISDVPTLALAILKESLLSNSKLSSMTHSAVSDQTVFSFLTQGRSYSSYEIFYNECFEEKIKNLCVVLNHLYSSILGIDTFECRNTQTCEHCGETMIESFSIIAGSSTVRVCRECYSSSVRCSRCGNRMFEEDAVRTREGSFLCKECAKYHYVLPYHRNYPMVTFYGDNHDRTVPFMGIELEVDEGGEIDVNATKVLKNLNKGGIFAYCSHDGSLNSGFEIITQPATMEYHTSIKDRYANAFNYLKEKNYFSHDTTTCGFHVHFNRDFFEDDEDACIKRMLNIVEKFWDEIVVFSRRNEYRMQRYARRIMPNEIDSYVERSNKSGSHEYHYYSINLSNRNTIEFRMFKGSLNIDTVLSTMNLVNNIVCMAKYKTDAEISSVKWEDLLTNKAMRRYWRRRTEIRDTEE